MIHAIKLFFSVASWALALPVVLAADQLTRPALKMLQDAALISFASLLIVAMLGLIALDPPLAIWGLSVIYALSGPLQYLRSADQPRQEGTRNRDKADLH